MEPLSSSVDVSGALMAKGSSLRKMEAAAKEFEAVFMAQMLKPMWEGIETDGMFGGGHGEEVMRDLLVQEYGKAMAAGNHHILAPAVMDVMIRLQNQRNAQQERWGQ